MSWCTIESDPGVFTELIQTFGVKDVCVEEIYSLDPSEQATGKSFGLIFLFKWRSESDPRPTIDSSELQDLFFARQIVQNACATQAILSILLNQPDITLSPMLQDLKDFTISLDPESRGISIGNTDLIREAHNSFARPEPFVQEENTKKRSKKSDEIYHFVAYIPHNGMVYELDGLKEGPILLGAIPTHPETHDLEDWWVVAKPAIEERMARYAAAETHFTLLTLCPDPLLTSQAEIQLLENQLQLSHISESGVESGAESIEVKLEHARERLRDAREKRVTYQRENARRRHNFLPTIMHLLHALAEKNKLESLVDAGKTRFLNSPAANASQMK